MTVEQIGTIVAACIVSAGGISGIIIAAIKFSSNFIADRLAKKYDLKLSKEMELYKNQIESKKSISKAMFDKEYEIYLTFNTEFSKLYNDIQLYEGFRKNPHKIKSVEVLLKKDNDKLLMKLANGDVISEEYIMELEDQICSEIMNLRNQLGSSGAFIPHENWVLLQEACNACHKYMLTKTPEDYLLISGYMGKMQSGLRTYLEQLSVIEGEK